LNINSKSQILLTFHVWKLLGFTCLLYHRRNEHSHESHPYKIYVQIECNTSHDLPRCTRLTILLLTSPSGIVELSFITWKLIVSSCPKGAVVTRRTRYGWWGICRAVKSWWTVITCWLTFCLLVSARLTDCRVLRPRRTHWAWKK
jgi:hypothetical protein